MALGDSLKSAFRRDPEDKEDQDVKRHTQKIWEYLKESRRRRTYEWFINDQFYDNNQYLKYNVASRRVQAIPVERVLDRIIINKTYQQVRGFVNFLNAEHPTIGVRPGVQSDDAYLRAKKEKHQADYWYDHLQLNKKFKLISLDGAKYGVGWAKILWDQDALAPTVPFAMPDGTSRSNTYGQVMVERTDPFEMYIDPLAGDMGSMRYLIHAPIRTLGELKHNPIYKNTDKLVTDNKLAADNMKAFELRQQISAGADFGRGQQHGMDTSVVLECFWQHFDNFANKWKLRITTRTEQGLILRDEDWGMNEYPFEYFQTDVAPLIYDSKGVIHNIREPNRGLNEIVSQIHETARVMGKLNWRVPRGSNVDVITDETGQFIEYDIVPGGAPEQTQAVNLPSYIMQEANMLVGFMEDIGGIHGASSGRSPFAQASGDLVNQLSNGDQNNLLTARDNFNDFTSRVFKKSFKTAKENYKTSRKVPTGNTDAFGEDIWVEIKPEDISVEDDVVVNTGPAMPYSIAEKQQMYVNLWKEKAITDPKLLFKVLEMPDIDAAIGDDEPDITRQLNEIRDMIKGKDPADPKNGLQPLISENHSVHIETLDKFVRGDRFKELSPKVQQNIMDHRQGHIELSIQLSQIQQAMQVEPIKRSETLMVRPSNIGELTPTERTQYLNKFGIQSDAAQIQLRGGLYIQDPAQAEMQAQNEDVEMMQMRAVQVSFGDNHQVHIETHAQVMSQPEFKSYPKVVQDLFQQHVKDHVHAMQSIISAPGLVPNDQISMPNAVRLKGQDKEVQQPQPAQNPNQSPKGNSASQPPQVSPQSQTKPTSGTMRKKSNK